MVATVRGLQEGEAERFIRSVNVPFLDPGNEEAVAQWSPHVEVDRAWVVEDRGRLVANACTFTRDVTVPGPAGRPCAVVPFAAVSAVGVHPTHRRRGLLRQLMVTLLDDARERGEAFAGLLASESQIYGRFGFGLATSSAELAIDTAHAAYRVDLEPPEVSIDLLDGGEATKVVPALHDRLRRRRAGDVSRNGPSWDGIFADRESERGGMSARMYAVCEDGFVAYRGRERGEVGSGERGRVAVRDLYGATPDIEAALWRFVLSVDLVDEVTAAPRPVDDPIRHRLAEPRALRTTALRDFLWVRVLDTAGTLAARAYQHPGRVVLDVAPLDDAPDPAAGRWVLDAGPDGVSCTRAGAGDSAEVRMGTTELGALSMGGVTASALAAAGRIDEERAGALAALDQLLATTPGPFSGTGF